MAELTTLSLGWGVQSWTLAAMVALRELPMVDFAIHADTTWEREATYAFAEQWTPWLEARGVRVVTVEDAQQMEELATLKTDLPAHTRSDGNGIKGMLRRQCTGEWKIVPMRRFIAAELARRGLAKTPGVVEQWLGITTDEWTRAKDSDVKYIMHRYPLLDLDMSRADCLTWLRTHDLPIPVKSSCVMCPYHNSRAWEEMKRENGADWQTAVEVDKQIRDARPPYPLFVHRAAIPLEDAVTIPEDFGLVQAGFLDDAECDSGYCFL